MKWFWQSVGAMLFAIIGGLIVVAFEGRVKEAFSPRPVHAEMYPSAWQPFPIDPTLSVEKALRGSRLEPFEIEEFTTGVDANFALIEVINRGHTPVTAVRFQVLDDSDDAPVFPPHILVVSEGEGETRTFVRNATDVPIPDIAPGKKTRVYVWRVLDMKSHYSTGDFRIISQNGPIPLTLHRYDDYQSRTFGDSRWVVFIERWVPVILFGLLAVLSIGGLIAAGIWESYTKKLLSDDGIYLNEKIRYDSDPKRFVPDLNIFNEPS